MYDCGISIFRLDENNFLFFFGSAQSTPRIEELLLEDHNVKNKRERCQKQSSLLSKLLRQLSVHDNRAAAAANWSDSGAGIQSIAFIYVVSYISLP